MPLSVFTKLIDIVAESMRVLPLSEAIRALPSGKLPARAVALTFDDGYVEWLTNVAPLLSARGLPATFFVTTGQLLGDGMWHQRIEHAVAALPDLGSVLPPGLSGFDNLADVRHRRHLARVIQEELKYLPLADRNAAILDLEHQATTPLMKQERFTPAHVRALRDAGFSIGAHTIDHPILRSVSEQDAIREIGGSKETLEGILREPVKLFAYPNGRPAQDFDARHVDLVRRCGYQAAVITGGGVATRQTSPFELPRFTPWTAHATRTILQIGSNMIRRAPLTAAGPKAPAQKVLLVENGAGFGGAIVAAGTLMRNTSPADVEYHVVTNVQVPLYQDISSIRSHRVLNDRLVNYRPAAQRVYQVMPRPVARALAFMLGRLDDMSNRLPYFFGLLLLVMRLRPHLIHGNNEPFSNREAMLVARLLRIPYVQHLRGPYPRVAHIGFLLRQPMAFIPVSQWLAAELRMDRVEPHRIRHVYDGIELKLPPASAQAVAIRDEFAIGARDRVIAIVGMLLPWKGQSIFIEAARQVAQRRADVRFLIVGGQPERINDRYPQDLELQAVDLVRAGKLHFTGHRRNVPSMMKGFDVIVSASLDPEPLGLVMLEGIVAGCEFVGPAHGASVEATRALKCGVLFEPGNATALANAILEVLELRERRVADPEEVLKRVELLFSPERCVQQTRKVYSFSVGDSTL